MKNKNKSVLIVVAHRDDETFGCGGTIAKLKLENYKIFAVSMTDGVSSRKNSDKKKIFNRIKNSENASKILGFSWLDKFCGDFKDNAMDDENILQIIKVIERVKNKINPELVITHFPEDLNIDHQVVAEATMTAFRPKFKEKCKKILAFEVPSSTDYANYKKKIFRPNYYVDIEKFWKKKAQALKAYKDEIMSYPNSRSLKGLKNIAKYRGNQVGVKMAESFQILRFIDK